METGSEPASGPAHRRAGSRLAAGTPSYSEHQDLSYFLTSDSRRITIRTPSDWRERRRHIVLGIEQVMGPLPKPERPVALDVVVLEEHREKLFTRRKVAYRTDRADKRVTAWLLLPAGEATEPRPAALCLHQTTPAGKDSPVGLSDRPTLHYARELTERGFVTLSPDYPSLGEHEHDFNTDDYASGSIKAIYDNIRAIDLLQSLPDVHPQRIGCIGHSLGGHNGLFTAVFDERIKAVVTCCGFTRFHKYMKGDLTGWSGPRYMPRIKSHYGLSPDRMPFDFTEVIAAIAPRSVFIVAPVHDDNFDVGGVRDVVAAAQPVFKLLGRPDRLRAVYPDAGHDFPDAARHEAYDFLRASLSAPR
ncbi:MAG TPA: prolyl oligopeptidase family serine peptidase [Lacipirellulaceae bacterium]|nr:prolyl oligopeptidase family serine peptidase [Lacipirellulaceae bacterium]